MPLGRTAKIGITTPVAPAGSFLDVGATDVKYDLDAFGSFALRRREA